MSDEMKINNRPITQEHTNCILEHNCRAFLTFTPPQTGITNYPVPPTHITKCPSDLGGVTIANTSSDIFCYSNLTLYMLQALSSTMKQKILPRTYAPQKSEKMFISDLRRSGAGKYHLPNLTHCSVLSQLTYSSRTVFASLIQLIHIFAPPPAPGTEKIWTVCGSLRTRQENTAL